MKLCHQERRWPRDVHLKLTAIAWIKSGQCHFLMVDQGRLKPSRDSGGPVTVGAKCGAATSGTWRCRPHRYHEVNWYAISTHPGTNRSAVRARLEAGPFEQFG